MENMLNTIKCDLSVILSICGDVPDRIASPHLTTPHNAKQRLTTYELMKTLHNLNEVLNVVILIS